MLDKEDSLIKRAQKGEVECFGRLYDHYLPKIYRYVLLKVSNRQEAEDLTHEVFISAWENFAGYRPKGFPLSSWLYNIARNRVIDYYRTKKSHISIENVDPDLFRVMGAVEREVDVAMDFEKVKLAMKRLSDDHQDILIMRFVDDLSHREIAQATNKSEGAVRLMQHRALQNLKEILLTSSEESNHGRQNN